MFQCNRIPLLSTYMEALTHEENVKPIRGTAIKPIHLRSRKYMQIKTLSNGDVVYFEAYSSTTPRHDKDYIIKWKENGEIHVRAPRFNCVYEQLTSALGLNFFRQANKVWVQTHNTFPLHPCDADTPSIFKRGPTGALEYTNPPAVTQKAINRSAANAVRSRYKCFYDYLRNMSKIHESEYAYREFAEVFEFELREESHMNYWLACRSIPSIGLTHGLKTEDLVTKELELANKGDLEMSHRLLLICAWTAAEGNAWGNPTHINAPRDKMLKAFDNFILRLHREEVFYDKAVPAGRIPSQSNNKFFR